MARRLWISVTAIVAAGVATVVWAQQPAIDARLGGTANPSTATEVRQADAPGIGSRCASRVTTGHPVLVEHDEFRAVVWSEVVTDGLGAWSVVHPTRLTVPVDGDYLIGGSVRWHPAQNGARGVRNIGIALNGPAPASRTQTHLADVEWVTSPYSGAYGLQEVTTYFPLSAGDYVELVAYQWNEAGDWRTTGAPVEIESSGGTSPAFWILRAGC